jgi:outer membrane protein
MNANRQRYQLAGLLIGIGASLAPSAHAFDLDDPLRTRPAARARCSMTPEPLAALTLQRALALAMCRQPQLQMALAEVEGAAAALGESRAAYFPTLTASISRQVDRTGYPDTALEAETLRRRAGYATLSWRLLDTGGRAASARAAELNLDALLASHAGVVQQVLGNVAKAYFEALTAQEAVVARTAERDAASTSAASAARRQVSGAGSRADTLLAASMRSKARLELGRAELVWQQALAQLMFALGTPAGSSVTLAAAEESLSAAQLAELDRSLPEWSEQVLRQHPLLVAARGQVAAARARATAVQADGRPTLDLQLNYYQNGRPGQSLSAMASHELSVGVVLTLPLFDGFGRHYKVRGALAQIAQREAGLREAEDQVLLGLRKSHAELSAALRNLPVASELLAGATETLQITGRRYEHGAAEISELMQAQSGLALARLEHLRALAEVRAARLGLLASAGLLAP